jgi:hypothetical protein
VQRGGRRFAERGPVGGREAPELGKAMTPGDAANGRDRRIAAQQRRAYGAQARDMEVDAAQTDGIAARHRERAAPQRASNAPSSNIEAHMRVTNSASIRCGCTRSAAIVTARPESLADQCMPQPQRAMDVR